MRLTARVRLLEGFQAIPLIFILTGCAPKAPAPETVTPSVGVVTLSAGPVTTAAELTGRVTSAQTAEIRPQVDGVIKARLFTEGAMVQVGQPLYQIDDSIYKSALKSAQAQLETAQATLSVTQAKAQRYQALTDNQAVSRQDIDDAKAAARVALASVHQAEAAVETAKVNLTYTRVLAPISGRIGRSSVTAGALVTAAQATALATIQQLDPIYVDITQSSVQLRQERQALAAGDVLPASADVRLKFDDSSEYPQTGTLEFSEISVDPETDTVTMRARFANPQGVLLPGMFVRVATPQGVVQNGLLVPQQGIARDPKGNATALIIDPDNRVVQRDVTTAQAVGNRWLITSGLSSGDRLIVEGTDKAKAGDTVKPVTVKLEN